MFAKPHVFEADLHEAETRRKLPEPTRSSTPRAPSSRAARREDAGEDPTAAPGARRPPEARDARSPSPPPPLSLRARPGSGGEAHGDSSTTAGRGCFPRHYDNPGAPSRRALTAILYLNPRWAPGVGGELVLAPFCAPGVRIAPTHDRLCVFLSDRVCHRVAPSDAERFCLTVWVDARDETDANRPEDATLRVAPEER